jgi:hypothetical protein
MVRDSQQRMSKTHLPDTVALCRDGGTNPFTQVLELVNRAGNEEPELLHSKCAA